MYVYLLYLFRGIIGWMIFIYRSCSFEMERRTTNFLASLLSIGSRGANEG